MRLFLMLRMLSLATFSCSRDAASSALLHSIGCFWFTGHVVLSNHVLVVLMSDQNKTLKCFLNEDYRVC